MADEGPTTTGSINAKLNLDIDEFTRKIEEAAAKADRLDGKHVDVKADANVGAALAGLEALQVAENKVRIAQLNLDDVNKKTGATEQAKLRAQNQLITAESQLAKLKAGSVNVSNQDTEATKRNTDAKRENAAAGDQQAAVMGTLIGASPVLLGGAAALTAALTALAGGFAVAGAAGILAIGGIKDEMAAGTALGNQYSRGLQTLKTDMDSLGSASAAHLLSGFDRIVQDVNQHMPLLNSVVTQGADSLGRMSGELVNGLLQALAMARPLLEAGEHGLEGMVHWISAMPSSNGFSQFIQYAIANLPGTVHLVEDLVGAAGHLIASVAPMGPTVIAVLDGVAKAIEAIPTPILGEVTTLALGAYGAFKAWSALAPIIEGVGGAVATVGAEIGFAVPAVGILSVALMGMGAMFGIAKDQQNAAVGTMDSYTDAVQRDSGALGDNTAAQLTNNLAKDGAYDKARKLGIGHQELNDAIMKGGPALQDVTDRMNRADAVYTDALTGVRDMTQGVKDQKDATDALRPIIGNTTQRLNEAKQAYTETGAAASGSAQATQAQQTALDQVGLSAQGAVTALDKYIADIEAAGLANISADQAAINFHSSIDAVTASVQQNGKSLDITTAAGRANKGAFDQLAQSGLNMAETNAKAGGSIEEVRGNLQDTYNGLIKAAGQFGVTGDAADAMARKALGIPPNVTIAAWMQDHASADIDAIMGKAHAADGTVINLFTVEHLQSVDERSATNDPSGVSRMGHYALGGEVKYLAGGGPSSLSRGTDTVPAMLTPGEQVIRRASAEQIRRDNPGALEYMNATGRLPAQQSQQPVVVQPVVQVFLDGRDITANMVTKIHQEIAAAARDARYTRVGGAW